MFRDYDVDFQFTCMEMLDNQQSQCGCGPAELVQLTRYTAWKHELNYGGENALEIDGDYGANQQIVHQASSNGKLISGFTYLRMSNNLFSNYNFNAYSSLVSSLHNMTDDTVSQKLSHLIKDLKKGVTLH